MASDLSNIHPVPIQKTLMLINNFVVTTTSFLNDFTNVCEKKLSNVSRKTTELEILLAVMEAKLNSIPESDGSEAQPSQVPGTEAPAAPAAPVAPVNTTETTAVPEAPPAPPVDTGMIAVKDHPDYKPFAKLMKVGVPLGAAKNKLMAAGLNLNPDYLENPEQMISSERATSTSLTIAENNID